MTLATLAVLLFAVAWIPVVLLRDGRSPQRRTEPAPDERRSAWNAALAVVVHVTLAALALRDAGADAAPVRLVTGILVALVGLAFWTLAWQALAADGLRRDPTAPTPALVTHGPFAIVRHPLALGMAILALGPAVAAATALTWASFAAVVAALARRAMQDEVELRATFGTAYATYAEATRNRLIPFVW